MQKKLTFKNIEFLPVDTLKCNFRDFSKCENEWRMVSDVFDRPETEMVKVLFQSALEALEELYPDEDHTYYKEETMLENIQSGKVVETPFYAFRIHTTYPKCPLCGASIFPCHEAYSRRDNETMICSRCAESEAFEDFFKVIGK